MSKKPSTGVKAKKKSGLSRNQILLIGGGLFALFFAIIYFVPPSQLATPLKTKDENIFLDENDQLYEKALTLLELPETAQEGKNLLEKLAEAKHVDSMNYLGYLIASSPQLDLQKAQDLFLEGAQRGNPHSLYALGLLFMSNHKDEKKAIEYWRQALKAGNGAAATSLGKCYESGIGVPADTEEAFNLFKKAAQLKDAEGTFLLSRYVFKRSKGSNDEERKGLRLLQESIKLGHYPALTALGELLLRGNLKDLPADVKNALLSFQKAAEFGEPIAMYNLGVIYETETTLEGSTEVPVKEGQENKYGVVPDKNKAFQYYQKSAEEYSEAMYAMFQFYSRGEIVEKDSKIALEYLTNAGYEGNAKAAITLLELDGTSGLDGLVSLTKSEVKEFLAVCIKSNDPEIIERAKKFVNSRMNDQPPENKAEATDEMIEEVILDAN